MREHSFVIPGLIFGGLGSFFGRVDSVIVTLVIFMIIDFITGIIAATVFQKSKHGPGGLESKVCWRGLYKKGVALLICLMAVHFDYLLGTSFVHTAVAIGFIVSEAISIIENAGLMGVPVPPQLKDAIAILKSKQSEGGR
jgi:toxin secretion/phage lysis holin